MNVYLLKSKQNVEFAFLFLPVSFGLFAEWAIGVDGKKKDPIHILRWHQEINAMRRKYFFLVRSNIFIRLSR